MDNKQKADQTKIKVEQALKDFPHCILFCTSENSGGFALANIPNDNADVRLQAQIYDTMKSNPQIKDFFKTIIQKVEE